MQQLPHYTKAELSQIVEGLQALTAHNTPVFTVKIINAVTENPIEVQDIHGSGMIYLKLDNGISVGNFAAWVDMEE